MPNCWLCFLLSRHRWLKASLLCLWSLMWPAADVHSRKTKAYSKACLHSARDMSRGYCHPCAHFKKTPPTMPGPGEMAHNGREPLVVLRNLTLRNMMPLAGGLLWALTLHTACSLLTLRASWWLSTSLYWGEMTNDGVWYGEICRQLAYKRAKPEGDGWHMVEYSTFTPPCTPLCLTGHVMWNNTVRKITSYIIHNLYLFPNYE